MICIKALQHKLLKAKLVANRITALKVNATGNLTIINIWRCLVFSLTNRTQIIICNTNAILPVSLTVPLECNVILFS